MINISETERKEIKMKNQRTEKRWLIDSRQKRAAGMKTGTNRRKKKCQ